MAMDATIDYLQSNLTIKLGSLLTLPSKFLTRLRRIDEILDHDLVAQVEVAQPPPPAPERLRFELRAMPGLFGFPTSGYALGLLIMTLLMNRIQHIVVPPRRSMVYRLTRSRRSIFHAIFYSIFPVDLSSTLYRIALFLPSLYLLLKSTFLLFIIILQVFDVFPSVNIGWLQGLGEWAAQKEMSDICWFIYKAVCLALVFEALTRGLEGINNANATPFNIFGYALLLHTYSDPMTHVNGYSPSRPDVNVLLSMFFPLCHLSLIHFLAINKKWSQWRLVPSSIFAFANIIHFMIVFYHDPLSYPRLNFVPRLLESALLVITVLTLLLNALTQVLLEGNISRPMFGHARSLAPKWDEDFAIVLLRLGTASLEATNVAGLGNEVGTVALGDSALEIDQQRRKDSKQNSNEGFVEISSTGVTSLTHPRVRRGTRKIAGGFAREIKRVKASRNKEATWFNHELLREVKHFGESLFDFIRGLVRLALWFVWYRWKGIILRSQPRSQPLEGVRGQSTENDAIDSEEVTDRIYDLFIRGEPVSDDEADYVPTQEAEMSESSDQDSEQEDELEDQEEEQGSETVGLFKDLLSDTASTSISPGPVLYAHMSTSNASPMTRMRYNRLVTHPESYQVANATHKEDTWNDFVQEKRVRVGSTNSEGGSSMDVRMSCVICTAEPREIICWPCRCLALCNDCRENLASRLSPSKHTCPCCRQSVEGFSRIYIP